MLKDLKITVINMKYLSQDIDDPVVIGAGDANGRALRIIFTQQAAAQFSENTKVYLSWFHQEEKIKGYNVFTEITRKDIEGAPPVWQIRYPQSMLYEGNVLACIHLVDEVSIASSTNFMIHILPDPNQPDHLVPSDDYSEFKEAVLTLNSLSDQMEEQLEEDKNTFDQIVEEFEEMKQTIATEESVNEIREIANQALEKAENNEQMIEQQQQQINVISQDFEDLMSRHIQDLTFYEFL